MSKKAEREDKKCEHLFSKNVLETTLLLTILEITMEVMNTLCTVSYIVLRPLFISRLRLQRRIVGYCMAQKLRLSDRVL